MKYNPAIVSAYFASNKISVPTFEYRFLQARRWRFDLAWVMPRVAVEVQGGIWTSGRHTQGAAMLKEWEKLNVAAALGWRILYCQPADLCKLSFVNLVKDALLFRTV